MEHRLEEAPIGIVTVREGVVRAYNDSAAEVLAVDDPDGVPIGDAFPRSVEGSLPRAFDGPSVSDVSFEEYYPTVDRWLSVSVVSGDDAATVYVSDVTERKERERTVERLRAASERAAVVDRLIADVVQGLIGATSREAILETIRERLGTSEQYRFAWTGERVGDGDELIVGGVAGDPGELFPAVREAIERGAAVPERRAVERQQPELIQSVSEDETVPEPLRVAGFADGVQSVLALPLVYGSSVYGVVGVYAETEAAFGDHVRSSFETLGELAGFAVNATQNRKRLFADAVTEVAFGLAANSPLVRASDACGVELTLEGTVAPNESGLTCFLTVSGGDPEAVVEAVDAMSTARDPRVVRRQDAEHGRIEVTLDETVPLVSAVDRGATVRTAAFDDGDGRLVVELPPDANVRRLAGAIGDDGPAPVLSRRDRTRFPTTKREFRSELTERLTERQATALRTAYLADYFRSPRGSTAEEVAASLGITGSTLLYHLRASQRKLLEAFYEERDGADPSDSSHG